MTDGMNYSKWVDRYVRNELSKEEEFEFEVALLESEELKKELETALGLKQLLKLSEGQIEDKSSGQAPENRSNWQPYALAASVILAVSSMALYWKANSENLALSERVYALSQPRTGVRVVSVDIMRSASSRTPDVRILKPKGHSTIILDIELAPVSAKADSLSFKLIQDDKSVQLEWDARPDSKERAKVAINNEAVPEGMYWLEISDVEGNFLERRLLEFRDRIE
jgi:hypothetical protein